LSYSDEVMAVLNDIQQELAELRRLMKERPVPAGNDFDSSHTLMILQLAILLNRAHNPWRP
jgi:hypothetical protein